MNVSKLSLALLCGALSACTGAQGETGATGNSVVADTETEPPGANCNNGGTKLSYGIDDNGNGMLDADEVDGSSYICNGSDGADGGSGASGRDTLVTTTPEAPGVNCAAGGLKVESGVDDNGNGMLDTGELDDTDYICAPSQSLIATAAEPAGANCPNGGTKITSGLDDDSNGTLEPAEVDATAYACDGTNGLKSLVATSVEPVGVNCVVGGTRVDYGVDDDNSNVLDPGEIDGTSFVCDAGQLFNSVPTVAGSSGLYSGGCGSHVIVGGADVVVRKLGALTNAPTAGNMKFVILNHAAADAVVYTSPAKAFAASDGWKYSDPVGITLLAGGHYCIATIADVSVDYLADFAAESGAGLSSVIGNTLLANYASPTINAHGGGDCGIQVITY